MYTLSLLYDFFDNHSSTAAFPKSGMAPSGFGNHCSHAVLPKSGMAQDNHSSPATLPKSRMAQSGQIGVIKYTVGNAIEVNFI